jgi:hypothetical protein
MGYVPICVVPYFTSSEIFVMSYFTSSEQLSVGDTLSAGQCDCMPTRQIHERHCCVLSSRFLCVAGPIFYSSRASFSFSLSLDTHLCVHVCLAIWGPFCFLLDLLAGFCADETRIRSCTSHSRMVPVFARRSGAVYGHAGLRRSWPCAGL